MFFHARNHSRLPLLIHTGRLCMFIQKEDNSIWYLIVISAILKLFMLFSRENKSYLFPYRPSAVVMIRFLKVKTNKINEYRCKMCLRVIC